MPSNLTLTGDSYTSVGAPFGSVLSGGYGQVSNVLPAGGTFTVRGRIRHNSPGGGLQVYLGKAGAFWMGMSSAGLAQASYGNAGTEVALNSSVQIGDNVWHDAELVLDAAAGGKLFIDGVLAASSATTPAAAGVNISGAFDVRSFRGAGFGGAYDFTGQVDEAAVFSTALHSSNFTAPTAPIANNAAGLVAMWHLDGDGLDSKTSTAATAVTISGPSGGVSGVASTNFTVGADGDITGTVVVTPSAGGGGGTFTPTTVSISSGTPTATFTYTPASAGAKSITVANDGGLSNPSALTYTATSGAATAVTMSGPSSGVSGVASTNFTVGADGVISGTVVVTPSAGGGGGAFTPTSVSISSGTPTATFTYTPASTGAKTISVTNNGSLSNPSNLTYTVSAPNIYDQVNATDTIGGQSIMVLVPNANSAAPYNAAVPTRVVLYAHGAGENQTGLLSDSLKATTVAALLNAGYILAGTNAHGENWGSQAAVDDYAALDKYVRDNYNVAGVVIWSQSMGGLAGLSALMQGKVKAIGWLGTYPVCNLANLHSLGTYTSAINTAYGITGSGNATYANRTYGHDPALSQGFSWRHVPMRFYASAGDTVVPKANNTDVLAALVAGCCRESEVVVCTGNHGHASHFQPSDTVAFFDRCFATPVALGRPTATRTVTITLKTPGGALVPNQSGVKVAVFDQATPDKLEYPVFKTDAESADGSAQMVVSFPSSLAPGARAWVQGSNTDGTSAPYLHFAGPVEVS